MGLLDEVRERESRSGPTCPVPAIVDKLDGEDRADLEKLMADRHLSQHEALAKALRDRGINVTANTISRHRRGICGCSRG